MFKRIRVNAGDTLEIPLTAKIDYGVVVRAQVTKGSGTPIARFQTTTMERGSMIARLDAGTTARMSGTYKYEIAIKSEQITKTLQYGILEVM